MTEEQLESQEELTPEENAFVEFLKAEGCLAAARAFLEQKLTPEQVERAKQKARENA